MLPELEIENKSHKELIMEAKERRKSPTKSEIILWRFLRNKNMYGFAFRRHAVCKNFIFDFYCSTLRLVVDIDYSVDDLLSGYYQDRDEKLRSLGYHVLRFKNDQILDNRKKVVRMIDKCVEEIWEMKKIDQKNLDKAQSIENYSKQKDSIPGPSPREGKGTRTAGGKGLTSDGQPIKFDVSRQTRDELIEQARYMRKNPTKAEGLLWHELRARKLGGFKFRRQHPIGTFIVDFYCPERKLVIEIDGPVHLQQIAYDAERETYLKRLGFYIIRFDNEEVISHNEQVLNVVSQVLSQTNDEGV